MRNLPPARYLTAEMWCCSAAARKVARSLLRLGFSASSLAYQPALGVFVELSVGVCTAANLWD